MVAEIARRFKCRNDYPTAPRYRSALAHSRSPSVMNSTVPCSAVVNSISGATNRPSRSNTSADGCPKRLSAPTDMTAADDLVLDCFVGSGTTAIAALKERRRYIGFELLPQYYELANARCRQARMALPQRISQWRGGASVELAM